MMSCLIPLTGYTMVLSITGCMLVPIKTVHIGGKHCWVRTYDKYDGVHIGAKYAGQV